MAELKVSHEGRGSFGSILPNWTVEDHITPVAPGETAEGAGRVTFSAKAVDEAELLINNPSLSDLGALGKVSGTIRNVTVDGSVVSVVTDTPLTRFNTERYFPPLAVGSGFSAIDLATQLIGDVRLNSEAFHG